MEKVLNHSKSDPKVTLDAVQSKTAPAFELQSSSGGGRKVFRGMKDDGGVPALGESKTALGVKFPGDLDVDAAGMAKHNEKGMSTSPDSPYNLPPFRRSIEWGGETKHPVWAINLDKLNTDTLNWHEDNPGKHGVVRPAHDMPYTKFKSALESTQSDWKIVRPETTPKA